MRERFISIQNTIEAIDRAIADEDRMAKAAPGVTINIKSQDK
jgi:hypothetical protein